LTATIFFLNLNYHDIKRINISLTLKKTEGDRERKKGEGVWESSLKQDSFSLSTPEVLPFSSYIIFNPLSFSLPFALPSNSKQVICLICCSRAQLAFVVVVVVVVVVDCF